MRLSTMDLLKCSVEPSDKKYVETMLNCGSTLNADMESFEQWWDDKYLVVILIDDDPKSVAKTAWLGARGWEEGQPPSTESGGLEGKSADSEPRGKAVD